MHRRDRCGRKRLQYEITIGNRVERICRRTIETQALCGHGAIEGKRRAGECGGAKRALVEAAACICEPSAIARSHLDIGKQVMPEGYRLGGLQVRETRHDGRRVRERLVGEGMLILRERLVEIIDGIAYP